MPIGIEKISYFLPGDPISNQKVIEEHGFEEFFIKDKLGIEFRHQAEQDQYASDLAISALNEFFQTHQDISTGSIELLVIVTQTPDYCLPHVSALAHAALGLSRETAAFDINLGCSGYVYGLATVAALMEAQGMSRGLVVTTETYSKLMSPSDRATAPLFGDAATVNLLSDQPLYTIGRVDFGTDGSRSGSLIARGSAVRRDVEEPLFMDGREIFGLVMREVPRSVARSLEGNGLEKDQIDVWVFHQANRFVLQSLAKRLGVPLDKILIDLSAEGNTTASTIPIILERHVLNSQPLPQTILISGFGVGLSWATTVLHKFS